MQGLGVFIHIDAGSIILVKIGGCGFDLLPRGAVDRPPFLPLAADQHQHHLEQPGRIIPIGVLAMMTTLAGLIVVLSMLVRQISDLFVLIKALFDL